MKFAPHVELKIIMGLRFCSQNPENSHYRILTLAMIAKYINKSIQYVRVKIKKELARRANQSNRQAQIREV